MIKICLAVLLAPVLAFAKPTLSKTDTSEIKSVAERYVVAFEGADYPKFRDTVTEHFVEMIGGEAAIKDRFAKNPSKKETAAKATASEVITKGEAQYVHVGPKTADDLQEGMWFRVVKVGKSWKLDAPAPDFAQ